MACSNTISTIVNRWLLGCDPCKIWHRSDVSGDLAADRERMAVEPCKILIHDGDLPKHVPIDRMRPKEP